VARSRAAVAGEADFEGVAQEAEPGEAHDEAAPTRETQQLIAQLRQRP
jgi:hypothetical protein